MTSYIHGVINSSGLPVHFMSFDNGGRSYDLFLGPGQSVAYKDLYERASVPVPMVENITDYHRSRICLMMDGTLWALYSENGKVRLAGDDGFHANAPFVNGFAGPGPMELTIAGNGQVLCQAVPFITGPQMAAVCWAAGRYALYGVNAGAGVVMQKAWLTDHWDAWDSLSPPAGGLRGPLAAVSWAAGRYAIYALGNDGLMYERSWLTTHWEDWIQHPAPGAGALRNLAAVCWETGRYGIYAVSENGNLCQKWWEVTKWHNWEDLGRPGTVTLAGPITAVCYSPYRYAIYALGSDGQVWQKWHGGGWSGWESIGRPDSQLKTLTSVSWGDRLYRVTGIGEDGDVWTREYRHGWQNWKREGRPHPDQALTGPVAAVSWRGLVNAVYAVSADGVMYQLYGSWSAVEGN